MAGAVSRDSHNHLSCSFVTVIVCVIVSGQSVKIVVDMASAHS